MRTISFIKIRFLVKRYISLFRKAFSLQYWKNDGVVSVVEFSDGSTIEYPTSLKVLRDIQSGNRDDILSINEQQNLLQIERASFGPGEADSLRSIMRTFMIKNGIHILFRENGVLVGYVSTLPADRFEISMMHKGFDLRYDNLYLYSIAGKADLFRAIKILRKCAGERSFKKLLSYCLNPRLVRVQKRFGFETIEIIPNWLPGKLAEYMELKI